MKDSLILKRPTSKALISQPFGQNANPLYKSQGLHGHTSIDWEAIWDSNQINCADEAYCYSTMHKDNPDPSRYRSIYTIVETKYGIYEISYGHCNKILAEVGKIYNAGDIIYTAGNTGTVYSRGKLITKEEKLAGSKAGTHLHAPQVRPVKRVKERTKGKEYLYDANGIFKKDGDYFEILDYKNGYNGCVDPEQFFKEEVKTDPIGLVPFQVALTAIRKSNLPPRIMEMAERILRKKYGR